MSRKCPVKVHIHHVGIFCSNMDRSIQWWREMFGFKLRRKVVLPLPDGGESRMCQVRAGGVYLELYDYPHISQQTEELFWGSLGTKHVCFYVEDGRFDEAVKYFSAKGIKFESLDNIETPYYKRHGDCRSLYFFDPDGTRIQLQEYYLPSGCKPPSISPQKLFRTNELFKNGPRLIIHHVGLYCSDLDRSITWYEEMLGFTKAWEGISPSKDGTARRMAILAGADMYIELHHRPDLPPQPKGSYWGTLGTKHMSLYMKEHEVPVLVKYLKSKEVIFTVEHHWDEKYNNIPGGYTVCFFNDPDGTTIEINGEFFPGEGLYPGERIYDL